MGVVKGAWVWLAWVWWAPRWASFIFGRRSGLGALWVAGQGDVAGGTPGAPRRKENRRLRRAGGELPHSRSARRPAGCEGAERRRAERKEQSPRLAATRSAARPPPKAATQTAGNRQANHAREPRQEASAQIASPLPRRAARPPTPALLSLPLHHTFCQPPRRANPKKSLSQKPNPTTPPFSSATLPR